MCEGERQLPPRDQSTSDELMNELWLPVPEWEDLYEASDQGRVRRLYKTRDPRILVNSVDRFGYCRVSLSRPKVKLHTCRRVHVCVMEAFVGPPPSGMQVAHLDGVRTNNRLDNLAYKTPADNAKDRYRHGTVLYGERNPASKLTDQQRLDIKHAYHVDHIPIAELARTYGVTYQSIWQFVHNR